MMKKIHLVIVMLLFFGLFAQAQTIEVSGLQSGSWEADTILVVGDVRVEESLHIMSGTTVLFDGFYGIFVEKEAALEAVGTETDSILFTVATRQGSSASTKVAAAGTASTSIRQAKPVSTIVVCNLARPLGTTTKMVAPCASTIAMMLKSATARCSAISRASMAVPSMPKILW